ncbi:MAG: hypothetical protein FWC80_07235, partial [Firmicutes bacterium]|nr:hypothetical protein [Bacillota bacterium]
YCDLVGVDSALSEIKHGTTLYDNGNGFYMPKIIVQRRGELGRNFNEAFSNFKNLNTIEILRLRYNLPDNDLIQFDAVTQKTLRLYNSASYHKKYYKNIYQIIYLNVFLSLKVRQYNISKSGIMEDEITEHQQIRKVIELYPWLSGEFKRY